MNRDLTAAERAWVKEQVATAPPLTEVQARTLAAIFGSTQRVAS